MEATQQIKFASGYLLISFCENVKAVYWSHYERVGDVYSHLSGKKDQTAEVNANKLYSYRYIYFEKWLEITTEFIDFSVCG